MRGLSLKDPFAWLIAEELKTIETRTWGTKYRGEVLICTSKKSYSEKDYALFCRNFDFYQEFIWRASHIRSRPGMAVAVATIINCRNMLEVDEPAAFCQYNREDYDDGVIKAWELSNIRKIKPFPIKGAMSLFKVSDEIKNSIKFL